MTDYMLSMYYPQVPSSVPDNIQEIMERVNALTARMREADALVWTGGLEFAGAARVVTAGEPPLVTEGPYLETNEAIGGFWILRADSSDEAHDWAAQASEAVGLPIEVRAFQG
ncbi:YciI family protein [Demequina sp.]|uniref:YciI family protein n=1 Tax=Demequina sp. TaxID=2050685 RepID=UPI003D0CF2B1